LSTKQKNSTKSQLIQI